jgi:DNA-binding transcriptional MerR regulator/effector-binding domain-containing protein
VSDQRGPTLLSIGDFARATHLSVKALRLYHEEGLLPPAQVDASSGYRRYDLAQIPAAQVIRRLRELDLPLGDIRAVLQAADPAQRGELLSAHLLRLEEELGRTEAAITTVRGLLEQPGPDAPVEHRSVPVLRAAAISAEIDTADLGPWFSGAFGELYATLAARAAPLTGAAGGVYADGLFGEEHGRATVYLPTDAAITAVGRVRMVELPAAELAVIGHRGPHTDVDRAYGALASYVTRRALAVDGPIREFYPVHAHHTPDSSRWRTEIGWPIFETAPR